MALKLSLKPDEKLVINGAVIANADRRATLIVHNKASILREKDILQEQDVDTPAKRIYFPIMLMYMDETDHVAEVLMTPSLRVALAVTLIGTIMTGVLPALFLDVAQAAASAGLG